MAGMSERRASHFNLGSAFHSSSNVALASMRDSAGAGFDPGQAGLDRGFRSRIARKLLPRLTSRGTVSPRCPLQWSRGR